ncbi:MAG: prefoldin alpha subunit [Haloarculaceae archaeon]|jgi:prefoldin alpha subunit
MSLGGGGGGGGGNPQLQELAEQLEQLEEHREALEAEVEALQAEKRDIDDAIEAVQQLETGSTVQVPLGGDAYVRAEIDNIDEVVVDLGGGYAAERDQDGAVSTLESKQETLDDRIEDVRSEIATIETESEELEERAQQLQAQQMQQMQQQQQQQPDE